MGSGPMGLRGLDCGLRVLGFPIWAPGFDCGLRVLGFQVQDSVVKGFEQHKSTQIPKTNTPETLQF